MAKKRRGAHIHGRFDLNVILRPLTSPSIPGEVALPLEGRREDAVRVIGDYVRRLHSASVIQIGVIVGVRLDLRSNPALPAVAA